MNSVSSTCQNCKHPFTIEPDDFTFYEKIQVPPPKICPRCRFMRRMQFRNEITLYTRQCMKCGKPVISMYNPKSPYIIYCESCYISDSWNAGDYAMDYNPARPFLDQLGELFLRVPKMTTFIDHTRPNVESEYVNYAGGHKHCYLLFNSGDCEESMYSRGIRFCKDTVDAYFAEKTERCYEVVDVKQSTGVKFSQNASGCVDSSFILNGSALQNCIGCVNLRNKSHQWFNEPLPADELKRRSEEMRGSYRAVNEFKKKFDEFSLRFPRRENSNLKTLRCTGEYIFESKNCRDCFETASSEDCRYAFAVKNVKDSYDTLGFGYGSELLLECVGVGLGSQNIKSTYWAEASHHLEYCFCVTSSENCFGCNGLKHAEYSILNKKYSKEEYQKLREKIVAELTAVGEYGLFFPPALAPFAYNETIAQDYFPLSKDEIQKLGFRWEDDIQITNPPSAFCG